MQDDKATFLIPRPVWVNDIDVSHCEACNNAFGPLRRRHHCRHCGNIFCHECSSKNVALPQLGYGSKPVRVCKGCFEVAYLVTYMVDDDHGISTQIHGARGLLELIEKDNERDIHNLVAHGGIDALIWLCRSSTTTQIHHLVTTILSLLAEKESVRPVIITKWALPALLYLIEFYSHLSLGQEKQEKKSPASSTWSGYNVHNDNSCQPTDSGQATVSVNAAADERIEMVLDIIINCTHILYQLARAGILIQANIVSDGVFDALLALAGFDPTVLPASVKKDDASQIVDRATENIEEAVQLRERTDIIQSLAAKGISAISSIVSNQPSVIELLGNTDKFAYLLYSPNADVQKYAAKTIAYLSLRNDKYKSALLGRNVARALVSIIVLLPQRMDEEEQGKENDINFEAHNTPKRLEDLSYYTSRTVDKEDVAVYPNATVVSHACCALANFGTNYDSQANLIALPRLLRYLCNVPAVFPNHAEIHRHVARCFANFALYEENTGLMLADSEEENAFNVIPTLMAMGQRANATSDVQRHIVRAIDNLSAHVPDEPEETLFQRREPFIDAYPFISRILETSKDPDALKRAESIQVKAKRDLAMRDGIERKKELKPKSKRGRKPKLAEVDGDVNE